MRSFADLAQLALELGRVALVLPIVERGLRATGPRPLLARLRQRARSAPRRPPIARDRLRRAVRWIDERLPGESSCLRRALLETALDRGAASQLLNLGVWREGGGHAWLDGSPDPHSSIELYDAVFRV